MNQILHAKKRLRPNGDALEFLLPGRNSSHRSPFQKEKQALVSDGTSNTHTLRKQKSHLPLAGFKRKVFISDKQAEPLHRRGLISCSTHLSC